MNKNKHKREEEEEEEEEEETDGDEESEEEENEEDEEWGEEEEEEHEVSNSENYSVTDEDEIKKKQPTTTTMSKAKIKPTKEDVYRNIVLLQNLVSKLCIKAKGKKKNREIRSTADILLETKTQSKKKKRRMIRNDNSSDEEAGNNNNNVRKILHTVIPIKKIDLTPEEKEYRKQSTILDMSHRVFGKHLEIMKKTTKMPIYASSNQVYTSWDLYLVERNILRKVMLNVCYVMLKARRYNLFITDSDVIWNTSIKGNKALVLKSSYKNKLKFTKQQIMKWHETGIDLTGEYKSDAQYELNCTWLPPTSNINDVRPKAIYLLFSAYNLATKHLAMIRNEILQQLNRKDVDINHILFIRIGQMLYEPNSRFKDPFQELVLEYAERGVFIEQLPWELFYLNILKCKIVPKFTEIKPSQLPEYLRLDEEKRNMNNKTKKKRKLEKEEEDDSNNAKVVDEYAMVKKENKPYKIRPLPINDVISLLYGWKPGQLVRVQSFIISLQQTIDFLRVSNLTRDQIYKSQLDDDGDEDNTNMEKVDEGNNNNNTSTSIIATV
jgi:hypothetical protein